MSVSIVLDSRASRFRGPLVAMLDVRGWQSMRLDRHVKRRILHGLGANAYGQLVVIIVQLAGVPILLHAWGTQLYGEWLILAAIPTYLSMADLGFSQSAGNDMTARMARGDVAGALAVFQSLSVLVYGVAVAGLLISAIGIWFLPIPQWFHFARLGVGEVRWIVWLLAAEVLIKLADGVNHAGFRSHGDFALHVFIYWTTMLAQMSAVWALAMLGYGPLAAAAAFAGIRALGTACSAVWLLRRHRDLRLGVEHARRAELQRLAKPAIANLSMPLAMALNIQGMVLVVGAILGPLAVVVFATLRTLTRMALQAVWQVAHAFEPELASAWGNGDKVLLRRLYLSAQRAGFWLALATAAALWWAGPWILTVWTHAKVAMNLPLFSWLLLSAVASVLWYCALNLLKAGNVHLRATLLYALSAAGSVVLAILLLRTTCRIADAGLALLVTDALMATYLLRSAARIFGTTVRDLIGSTLDPRPLILHFNRMLSHVAGR